MCRWGKRKNGQNVQNRPFRSIAWPEQDRHSLQGQFEIAVQQLTQLDRELRRDALGFEGIGQGDMLEPIRQVIQHPRRQIRNLTMAAGQNESIKITFR
jgi:hypothetical protein